MQIFFTVYFFMMGALFASFLNVVGIRVYDHCSLLRSSHCPKCNNKLRWCDIIPIFGYLINGGKCHFCKERIHIKYFLIEVLGGVLLATAFWFMGFSLVFLYSFFILCMLLVVAVGKYEYNKIMSKAIYIFLGLALVLSIYIEITEHTGIIYKSLIGAGIIGILAYLMKFINPNNKNYLFLAVAIGFAIQIEGVLLFLIVLGVLMLLKLIIKKLPILYLVTIATMVSFVFSTSLIDVLTKII